MIKDDGFFVRMHHFMLQVVVFCDIIKYNAAKRVALGIKHKKLLLCQKAEHFYFLEEKYMAVSYKKLWKLLIDKDMKKKDLCAKAGISSASVTKMGKGGHVTTEVLVKICSALDCTMDDIIEVVPVQENK